MSVHFRTLQGNSEIRKIYSLQNNLFVLYGITHHKDGIAVMMDFVLLPSGSKLLQSKKQPQKGVPLLLGIVEEMRPTPQ